jgi:hypothetical protein
MHKWTGYTSKILFFSMIYHKRGMINTTSQVLFAGFNRTSFANII